MNSVRERILLNLYIRLYFGVTMDSGTQVVRMPANPVVRDDAPLLLFAMEEDSVLRQVNTAVERAMTVRIVALARGKNAWDVADKLMVSAHAVMLGDASPHYNLDGNALAIKEVDCEWEADETDDSVVSIPARYQIHYRTRVNDITQVG